MIFFFYGANSYAARQQVAKLVAEYIKKTGSDMGLERIDGAAVKPDTLRANLTAAPFLASSRLVIVEDLGKNKTIAPKIEEHLKGLPETTVAVFYDSAVDQRTVYFKTLSKTARTVHFESLSQSKLHQWVAREVTSAGGEIDRAAIGRLLELAGEDQWRLSNEIAKLVAHNPTIDVEAINELVDENHTETIFNLVEAMTAGKSNEALRLYRQLKQDGQNEMYMLSMVIWQLKNLVFAKSAGSMPSGELAKLAGMSPFVAQKMLSKRHLFEEQQLKGAFLEAVDTDYRIKSGGGSAEALVEQLIFHIASRGD